jgi:hypothetical protein
MSWGRELLAIHEYVVADEQRILHGTGGDLESLHDKRNNEKTSHQDGGERSKKFHRCLTRLLVFFVFCH